MDKCVIKAAVATADSNVMSVLITVLFTTSITSAMFVQC